METENTRPKDRRTDKDENSPLNNRHMTYGAMGKPKELMRSASMRPKRCDLIQEAELGKETEIMSTNQQHLANDRKPTRRYNQETAGPETWNA